MVAIEGGRLIDLKPLLSKAWSPTDVTEDGIFTDFRSLHRMNAGSFISVKPSLSVTVLVMFDLGSM